MKKLLGLLAVTPLAVTACGGGGTAGVPDSRIERSQEYASVEVRNAIREMFVLATGKVYSETEDAKDPADRSDNIAGAKVGNWFGNTDSIFNEGELEWMTVGEAYRAALYFGLDTAAIFETVGSLNGELMNGALAFGVEHATFTATPAYYPAEAKKVIDAIKEQHGHTGAYDLSMFQNTGSREDIAALAAANWTQIGVDLNLQTTDWPTHLELTFAGEHGGYVGGWTTVTGHAGYGLWGPFHSSAQGSGGNRQFVGTQAIDEALEAAAWSNSAGADYAIAQDEITKKFATIPLYSGDRRMIHQNIDPTSLEGGTLQKAAHHDFGNIVMDSGNEFTIAVTGAHASLHPHGGNDSASTLINKHVYESLWLQNSDATSAEDSSFESLLIAEDINDLNLSTDGKVNITIRDNIQWGGTTDTLTGQEVVESINAAISAPQIAGVVPGVLGAEIGATAQEVTLHFGEGNEGIEQGDWITADNKIDTAKSTGRAYSAWKQSIAHAGFAINRVSLEDFNDTGGTLNGKVEGTGRYTLDSVDSATDNVVLKRNDNYHGASATAAPNYAKGLGKVETINFRVVADTTAAFLAFEGNEVDMVDAVTLDHFEGVDADEAIAYGTFSNSFIGINVWEKR